MQLLSGPGAAVRRMSPASARPAVVSRPSRFQLRRIGAGLIPGASGSPLDVVQTAGSLLRTVTDAGFTAQAHSAVSFMHSHLGDGGQQLLRLQTAVNSWAVDGVDPGSVRAATATASLPVAQLALVDAAVNGLPTASSLSTATAAGQAASLQALSLLAGENQGVANPDSLATLRASVAELLHALRGVQQGGGGGGSGVGGLDAAHLIDMLLASVRAAAEDPAAGVRAGAGAAPGFDSAAQALLVAAAAATAAAARAAAVALPPPQGLVPVALGAAALGAAALRPGAGLEEEAVPVRYSPNDLAAYWSKRPLTVVRRSGEVVTKLVGFLIAIIADSKTGVWESRMPSRAAELRVIVEGLGATCIKIAQAASTRVDMLPQVYLDEFARLQDNVQTFSTVEARDVLEEGLGRPVDTIFEWLSAEPLAAASLGQVYRGKLRAEYGGNEVAVKVQRPGVLGSAALDVFIMRRGAMLFSKLPGMSDQWANVLDDWALRFFEEMDYELEAYNTMTFKKQMSKLKGIVVPTIHPGFTSRKVIVSDWIDGEKLGDAPPGEVRALCSTLLNCYLIQLLETGLLHVDPHPGNLMRMRDGKLVILDFGLMTEVTEAQRIGLVEFIAHLTMEDWDALTQDLVTLGFMPQGMSDEARSHVRPVMTEVFSKIVSGGGLGKAGLNFASLGFELSHISMNFQMCIPGYFTNVIRAFSVIEGTALKVDPDYSIVAECSPYLSRRLLTDNNPRMRTALRQLLYGNSSRLDIARLQRLLKSFSAFTTSATTPAAAAGATPAAAGAAVLLEERVKGRPPSRAPAPADDTGPVVSEAVREALRVVFSKDGLYVQELIVEELVAATDAMSRAGLSEAFRLVMSSAAAVSALSSVEALGPLRAMLSPLSPLSPLPFADSWLRSMSPSAPTLTSDDHAALSTLRAVLDLIQPGSLLMVQSLPGVARSAQRGVRAAGEVAPLLPELLPGITATAEMFARQLVRRMAQRLADDLSQTPSAKRQQPGGGGGSSGSSQTQGAASRQAATQGTANEGWPTHPYR
ncbi:hypothetical protein FOA52_006904 [Chlamydomonas sp. UWO 241]|nr:hypothetical protein FOA52_006904 [Chlamydomonas sp. UWO 241]